MNRVLSTAGFVLLLHLAAGSHVGTAQDAKKNPVQMAKPDPALKLKELKQQLNTARSNALKTIFNTRIYPEANHGKSGQSKVDEVVKAVRDLWNGNPGLKTFGIDSTEQKLTVHNEKVDKYNQDFKGVGSDIKDQVRITNEYRDMMGLKKLFIDEPLCQAAQFHSENMAKAGKIWHDGSDGTMTSRLKKFGVAYVGAGENVAFGYNSPQKVHDGWYNSSGHHRNLLSKFYNAIGVGHVNGFWTQDFANLKRSPL